MRILIRLLFLAIFSVILLVGWFYLHIHSSIRLTTTPFQFSISPGSNLKQVSQQLEDAGVIHSKWSLILLARYLDRESAIKAGDYQLDSTLTQIALLDYLTKGDAKQNAIQFIEGWTFNQLKKTLRAYPNIQHDIGELTEQEILHQIGATETTAEGLFFPDTYFFIKGDSDIHILRRAYQAMQTHLQHTWHSRSEGLPLATPYEALILASIIEKETGTASDRAEIAGVFINRLRKGMKLQTDPTIIYGLGDQFDGNLRKKDLLADQAYNTYTRAGLPPTPIALPSLASIRAALNPAETDALYFVAKGNGESEFSTNLADHNKAVDKYQKQQK
ncbi:endolytic transglycosylase MltG [Nitrosomonas sp. JL21]|uniref:endolytic transglycosylase MltG n=1 Tax=Nitrosomonas sp. JL21 TaxID=153949 RepID=UPI0013704B83|nr:endolytic transglycosylase MltG [Nitrosomonas sp. JL21]MBL8498707.1 endolytic transglycosylase MltG [Nitrosomonas sp.]MCC7091606.1 endolytic transglycosylase MltG [Nitrosomonas sp.]MXS77458.1 endolytic transglycosylase MltG [Nitrosomonas sp. JL21]